VSRLRDRLSSPASDGISLLNLDRVAWVRFQIVERNGQISRGPAILASFRPVPLGEQYVKHCILSEGSGRQSRSGDRGCEWYRSCGRRTATRGAKVIAEDIDPAVSDLERDGSSHAARSSNAQP
jgi:hypothetical protein